MIKGKRKEKEREVELSLPGIIGHYLADPEAVLEVDRLLLQANDRKTAVSPVRERATRRIGEIMRFALMVDD